MMSFLLTLASYLVLLAGLSPAGIEPPEEQLWQAAREGDLARVQALLESGVPVDAKSEFDCTALYFAANNNRPEVIRALLAAGADPGVRDNDYGFSAMQMAGWLGHTEAVEALLEADLQPNDVFGAFFAAIGNGHAGVVAAISATGKIPQAQLDAGLGTAIQGGADEVAAVLRRAGAKAPQAESGDSDEKPESAAPQGADTKREAPAANADPGAGQLRVQKPVDWPEFRGAGRTGIADGQHPPAVWEVESGRNVKWKTAIEGLGYSSPIIWKDRVFVTTAVSERTAQTIDDQGLGWIAAIDEDVSHEWQLRAYDLKTGELVWKRSAHSGRPKSQRHWKASQANPTCATDGKVVVAFFGSEGLYAYDFAGKLLWKRDLGVLNAGWYIDSTFQWGFASSPIIDDGRVIVQADFHGSSFVAAFDLRSGKELWRSARDEIPAWGTPVVYRTEKHAELVLNASKSIVGYDPATGNERWRIRGNSPITVASPLAQDGMIIATGGYRTPKPIYVVEPGARGDITPDDGGDGKSIVWSTQTEGVYIVTPLLYRGILYLCKNNGVLTAYDPSSGERLFRERLGGSYTASPVAADGRIYFTSEEGEVTVIEAGKEFRVVARSELSASVLATPAISNGMIVFRTVRELIGIGFTEKRAEDS